KWEKLLKRRDLMHVEAYKEFHKNLTVSLSKKKEVVRSSVRGVNIEMDKHDTCFNSRCSWLVNLPRVMLRHMAYVISAPTHELLYGDRSTMVFEAYNVPLREQGVWWLEIGGIHRRDDEDEAPAKNNNQEDFEWEAVNEEAEIQGEFGSTEKFYDAEDDVQGSADVSNEVLEVSAPVSDQQKEKASIGVDPSVPTGSIPDPLLQHFQAELDRARADRLQVELDKARAENARLQALLRQASSQPKP
ncbi:hypothetical protein Dimus_037700, partial [Dionaea muscipula]